jgi:hypothetical protein
MTSDDFCDLLSAENPISSRNQKHQAAHNHKHLAANIPFIDTSPQDEVGSWFSLSVNGARGGPVP